jgi:hypothetical protein
MAAGQGREGAASTETSVPGSPTRKSCPVAAGAAGADEAGFGVAEGASGIADGRGVLLGMAGVSVAEAGGAGSLGFDEATGGAAWPCSVGVRRNAPHTARGRSKSPSAITLLVDRDGGATGGLTGVSIGRVAIVSTFGASSDGGGG